MLSKKGAKTWPTFDAAGDPEGWLRAAERQRILAAVMLPLFLDAAKRQHEGEAICQEAIAYMSGWMYHAGLRFELTVKAVLARRNPARVLKISHAVTSVAKDLLGDPPVTVATRKTLKRYEEAVWWTARYPVAKDPVAYEEAWKRNLQSVRLPDDQNLLEDLIQRLEPLARG